MLPGRAMILMAVVGASRGRLMAFMATRDFLHGVDFVMPIADKGGRVVVRRAPKHDKARDRAQGQRHHQAYQQKGGQFASHRSVLVFAWQSLAIP